MCECVAGEGQGQGGLGLPGLVPLLCWPGQRATCCLILASFFYRDCPEPNSTCYSASVGQGHQPPGRMLSSLYWRLAKSLETTGEQGRKPRQRPSPVARARGQEAQEGHSWQLKGVRACGSKTASDSTC